MARIQSPFRSKRPSRHTDTGRRSNRCQVASARVCHAQVRQAASGRNPFRQVCRAPALRCARTARWSVSPTLPPRSPGPAPRWRCRSPSPGTPFRRPWRPASGRWSCPAALAPSRPQPSPARACSLVRSAGPAPARLAGVARRAAAPGEAARGDGSAVRGLSTSTSPPSPTSPAALSTAHAPMAVPVRRRGRWPGGRLRSVGGSVSRSSRRGARRRGRCRGGRTRGCGAGGPEAGRRPAARPLAGVVVGELERRPRRVLAEGRGHGFHEVSFPVGARVQRFCRHDLGVPSARCFVQRLMMPKRLTGWPHSWAAAARRPRAAAPQGRGRGSWTATITEVVSRNPHRIVVRDCGRP